MCRWLLVAVCLSLTVRREANTQKTPSFKCSMTGEIRLDGKRENTTSRSVTGMVETCDDGVWKVICDCNWSQEDATVACRELGYSDQGAEVVLITLSVIDPDRISPRLPVCTGDEYMIRNCAVKTIKISSCGNDGIAAVRCYLKDSLYEESRMVTTSSIARTPTLPKTTCRATTQSVTTEDTSSNISSPELDPITTHAIAVILGVGVTLFCVLSLATLCNKRTHSPIHNPQHNPGVLTDSDAIYDQPSNGHGEPTETINLNDPMSPSNQEQDNILFHNPAYSIRQREISREQITRDGPVSREQITGDGPVSREQTTGDGPVSREQTTGDGPVSREQTSGDGPVSREQTSGDGPVYDVIPEGEDIRRRADSPIQIFDC